MVCKVDKMLCAQVRKGLMVWQGQFLLHSTCGRHKVHTESFVYKKSPPTNQTNKKKPRGKGEGKVWEKNGNEAKEELFYGEGC